MGEHRKAKTRADSAAFLVAPEPEYVFAFFGAIIYDSMSDFRPAAINLVAEEGFEANLVDSGDLSDSYHSSENDGQNSSQHGYPKSVTAIDDVHERTIPAALAPDETVQRNPKVTQGLHKIHTSFYEECQPEESASRVHSDLVELAALWSRLDNDIRYSIMTIARRTAFE